MTHNQYMSRQEAAFRLSVTVAVVDRLIATGALDRYRLRGRYVRVLRTQVEELAELDPELLRNA